MTEDRRPDETRTIDTSDAAKLQAMAEEMHCRPEHLAEAVERVGPNRTAVELYLAAPKA